VSAPGRVRSLAVVSYRPCAELRRGTFDDCFAAYAVGRPRTPSSRCRQHRDPHPTHRRHSNWTLSCDPRAASAHTGMPLGKRHGFILELASDAGGRARMVVKGPCDAGGAGTAAPRTPTRASASRAFWPDPCTLRPALHDRKPPAHQQVTKCAATVTGYWPLQSRMSGCLLHTRIPTEELMRLPLAPLLFSAVAGTAEARNCLYRSRCINGRPPNGIPRVRYRDYPPNAQIQCRLRRSCQPTASGPIRQFRVSAKSNLLDLH